MQKATLFGRLTQDWREHRFDNGGNVANNSLACKAGKDLTDFWNVKAANGTADALVKYAKKGDQLLVHGNLGIRKYTDNLGNERESTELFITDFEFVSQKRDDSQQQQQPAKVATIAQVEDEDMPF